MIHIDRAGNEVPISIRLPTGTTARPAFLWNEKVEIMIRSAENCKRRILLVDDCVGMLRVLKTLIETRSDLKVCAVATNENQAHKAIDNQSFDLAVVDISLGCANGLELAELMKSRCPEMFVVIFSSHDELSFVEDAFRAGARGYVTKPPETAKEIVTAIRKVLDGEIYISPRITQGPAANNSDGRQRHETVPQE